MTLPNAPMVSVVMPVCNPHPDYFRQSVLSILNQHFTDFELLVIEKPSSVSAEAVLAEFSDPRMRYIRMDAGISLVAQRNYGLAQARAGLVAMMDADDVADPQRLSRQLSYLEEHPDVAVLGSDIRIIDMNNKLIGYRVFPKGHESIAAALVKLNVISQPSVILRRAAVLEAGGYCQTGLQGVEDYELWCRLVKKGLRFDTYPQALISYRIHPQQIKCQLFHETVRGTLKVKDIYWQREDGLSGLMRRGMETALLCLPRRLAFWLCVQARYRRRPAALN